MLTGPREQERPTTLNLLVKSMRLRGWKPNPTKLQGPSTSVTFPQVQRGGLCRDTPSKGKDKLLVLSLPSTMLRGSPWILEAAHPSLCCVTLAHIPRALESCSFQVWPRKEGSSSTGPPTAVQTLFLLGLCDPACQQ